MISREECRRILGPGCSLSESGLEQLRNLAAVIVDSFSEVKSREPISARGHAPVSGYPRDARDIVEERAAILQFDGGMTREDAEQAAMRYHPQGSDR